MDQNHVITVDQVVEMMNTERKSSPKLLHKCIGKESCCIFKVPQSLRDINKEAYQPQIVSIGPYHHGSKDLEMIQEHKWVYLDGLLERTSAGNKTLKCFLDSMMSKEKEIRESYSESIEHICSNDLAKMMVLDGVFLIELFRKIRNFSEVEDQDDPILNTVWMFPFLMRDFLRIENQIPFFVLQKLFDESQTEKDVCLLPSLILKVFNYAFVLPDKVLEEYVDLEGKHLLDFFRNCFKNSTATSTENEKGDTSIDRIKTATKLVVAGVKFKNHEAKSFLDIKFQKGVLSIPRIKMDDFFTSFLLNAMIFEQCYSSCSKDITTYFAFLGCLINASTDVSLLSESKIIENYLGTNEDLVKFINDGKKEVAFDIKNNYLKSVFKDVNKYYNKRWRLYWTGFKHKYFESPWAFISLLAASVLLLLAAAQTFYTIYPYYHEGK